MSVTSHFATKEPSVFATYRRGQTSANRWHVEVRLIAPAQVDRQLTAWLRGAYELAGP